MGGWLVVVDGGCDSRWGTAAHPGRWERVRGGTVRLPRAPLTHRWFNPLYATGMVKKKPTLSIQQEAQSDINNTSEELGLLLTAWLTSLSQLG